MSEKHHKYVKCSVYLTADFKCKCAASLICVDRLNSAAYG